MDLMQEQLKLETEMRTTGIETYRSSLSKSKERGNESNTLYGIHLMKNAVEGVTEGIREFLGEAFTGKAGKVVTVANLLGLLEEEKAAFIALKFVVDGVSSKYTLTKVAMAIGQALEDEFKFSVFQKEEKAWFSKVRNEVVKRTSNRQYRRYAIIHTMDKKAMIDYEPWTKQEKLHLGIKLVDLIREKTGLIQVVTHVFGRKQRQAFVEATEKTLNWIEKVNQHGELLSPHYLPCVVPPKDWVSPFEGGYHTDMLRPIPMIKTHNKAYLQEMEHHEMPMEYAALNALQKTAWGINEEVLAVMEQAWESGETWGIPSRHDMPVPVCPISRDVTKDMMTEEQRERFVEWKHQASRVHQSNARLASKRLHFIRTLQMAQRFNKYDRFYYPYQSDFRGRKYAVPSFLTPQGAPFARALLRFAEGVAIETQEQADWLAIQGSNTFGYDKAGLQDRVLWVYLNSDKICSCAQDPWNNRFWTEADDPWSFLAFCFEWADFTYEGFGFKSRLPIHVDGSNNGLQHFSAQLRDSVGGFATNLVPSTKPQDIYQQVADRVIVRLKEEAAKGEEMAQQWLDFGISRKTTKRPVMVVPYGGQRYSCRSYLEEYIVDQMEQGKPNPWGNDLFKPSQYLTPFVWESISEVVVSARKAMDWIQEVASEISKLNLPLHWTSPSGFVVFQQYPETQSRRISTYIDNSLIKPVLQLPDWGKVDKRRSVNGASPNFVHSMDAAAMTLTIDKGVKVGIKDFAMIHDSYGVHAAHMPTLAKLLREAFVEMYVEHDVLEEYRKEALKVLDVVPPVPAKGDLDIEAVRQSDFFFS